jgi:pimeloyl-ACP methyl ester carboxylesterase
VGLLLAHEQPGRITSLILDGAVLPGAAMPYTTFAIDRARASATSRGMAAAREDWFDACDWFNVIRERPVECRADEHRQLIAAFAGGPWLDEAAPAPVPTLEPVLPSMTVPVLLVNGEHDVPEFLATAQTLRSAMPRAERIIIPAGGGFPLWEFPAAVNAQVEAFLGGVSAPLRSVT